MIKSINHGVTENWNSYWNSCLIDYTVSTMFSGDASAKHNDCRDSGEFDKANSTQKNGTNWIRKVIRWHKWNILSMLSVMRPNFLFSPLLFEDLTMTLCHYPLFRVRSWNIGMRCMSFYILMETLSVLLALRVGHLLGIHRPLEPAHT